MENIDEYLEQEFSKKLKKMLREHRKKRKLSIHDVSTAIGKASSTYKRWESTGKHLTDIFSLLNVFHVLGFSTVEVIDVLGLPPLTLNEVESIYQDEEILKSIKGNGTCSVMREKCPDIDDFTLQRLLIVLMKEHVKRLESRLKRAPKDD